MFVVKSLMNNKIDLDFFLRYHLNNHKAFTLEGLAKKADSQEEIDSIEKRINMIMKLYEDTSSKIFSTALDIAAIASSLVSFYEIASINSLPKILSKYGIINSPNITESYSFLAISLLINMGILRMDYLINHDPILTQQYLKKHKNNSIEDIS